MDKRFHVPRAHSHVRLPRCPRLSYDAQHTGEEYAEDPDPSPSRAAEGANGGGDTLAALGSARAAGVMNDVSSEEPSESAEVARAKPWPTLSFRALGGAGEVGGSSHL